MTRVGSQRNSKKKKKRNQAALTTSVTLFVHHPELYNRFTKFPLNFLCPQNLANPRLMQCVYSSPCATHARSFSFRQNMKRQASNLTARAADRHDDHRQLDSPAARPVKAKTRIKTVERRRVRNVDTLGRARWLKSYFIR
jgi:hypothetical protein